MTRLSTTIRRDVALDVTTLQARGELSGSTAPQLGDALEQALGECPATVIVDLAGCVIASVEALDVLEDVIQAASDLAQPPVDVLVCGRAVIGHLPWYGECAGARAAAARCRARHPAARLDFERSDRAPARMRERIGALCRRWSLPRLCADAELVVSELVTNAVTHGGTGGRVEVALRDGFLHIRVEDGSPSTPGPTAGTMPEGEAAARPSGRGLALVRRLSSAWGYLVDDRGSPKVVWAALRLA